MTRHNTKSRKIVSHVNVSFQTTYILQITGAMPSDSGRYICTASDGITVITDTVELRVTGKKGITGRTFVHLIIKNNFSISIPNSKIYLNI